MSENKTLSPFQGRSDDYKEIEKVDNKDDHDVITYAVVDCVIKYSDAPEDFKVYKKIVEIDRKSRRAELNKYASDVGCVNVIKKLARQGINAADGRFNAAGGYIDSTQLPQDLADMFALSREVDPKTSAIWNSIPEEMKKGMDLKTFAEKFNPGMVEEYVKAHSQVSEPKKEGE